MGITLFLAAILAWLHPGNSFNEVESMVSLKEKLRKDFPSVQVVMGWDLAKEDIDNGPWAMAQTPIEFGKKHHLLYRNPDNNMVMVDKIRAKVLFCQQLGPLWPGVEQLPPYQKALFAAFCAFINYNRDEAENFLANIERSVTRAKLNKKELDFSGTAALIKKYGNSPDVQRILKDHAYFHTVFIEMLATARRSGIVANSSYLWLKPIDRPLWYALNNLGRKAVFVEMASAHAHWLAEKKLGFALTEPMVEEAIYGLEEAVKIRVVRDI
jgi:intracellular multiplication protein IcmP